MKGFHKLSMHGKYEVAISRGSKMKAKVKVYFLLQTGQNLDAPEFLSHGIKIWMIQEF